MSGWRFGWSAEPGGGGLRFPGALPLYVPTARLLGKVKALLEQTP